MRSTRITAALLAGVLFLSLCPAATAAGGKSTPVDEAAQVVSALDIMVGDETGNMYLDRRITREEFVVLAVKASPLADQVGQASTSPYPDVPYTRWSAGHIQLGVAQGYASGYLDGTFKPEREITLAEGAAIVLKLLGYTASDFSGAYPSGQMAMLRSLKLDTDLTASRPDDVLTRQDAMYLFYNLLTARTKTGTVYLNQLGYATTASGEIDRVALLNATMDGPVVASGSWQQQIPFSLTGAAVYRSGRPSSLSAVQTNDVIYWSKPVRTLWVYGDRATGTIQVLTPSASAPTAVTVAGRSYSIETASAAYDLSDLGQWRQGDSVTLLLGRGGGVAAVAAASDSDAPRVGVVTQVTRGDTYTDGNGNRYTADSVTIMATDGQTYRYESRDRVYMGVGELVQASVRDGKVTLLHASSKRLSGRVSSDGKTLGSYTLAPGIEILDAYEDEGAVKIYPSRLAGMSLGSDQIGYYSLNSQGQIDRLILKEATGDGYRYGILTQVTDMSMGMSINVTYQMDLGGVPAVLSSTSTVYPVKVNPVMVQGPLNDIQHISNLTMVKVDRLTSAAVYAGNQSYSLWDGVLVYELRDGKYYLSSLERAIDGEFQLTAWYDRAETSGGRIRVIVAS